MNERKVELRSIIMDILAGRERTTHAPNHIAKLLSGVAEVLNRREGKAAQPGSVFPGYPELDYDDRLIAQEICWDLIVERIITPGYNFPNSELPYIRVHSEAQAKLNTGPKE
jgi:hypothetical protein